MSIIALFCVDAVLISVTLAFIFALTEKYRE